MVGFIQELDMAGSDAATVLFLFWGYVKWNLHFKNNFCIVSRSSNPMKQSARELTECSIQSVDIQDQNTLCYG